jgi:hypothetical protein
MAQEHSEVESTCPVCRSRKVQSMSYYGIVELICFRLMRIYPFWCNDCSRRFYQFFSKPPLFRQESRGDSSLPPHALR